ncbi:ferrous iron transport protein B [bacterium]|nr:ferrous iron transport protein B [bacterium]
MATPRKTIRIALAGNPNCGKTSVFNNLTGAHQHVGNWPGVTVEQKSGDFTYDGVRYEVIDLPGTYSLSAYSVEEEVVERFLRTTPPDVLVNIVDATNLERHLFLTAQLIEQRVPMVVALNMMDEAEEQGLRIDDVQLAQLLDVPVVPIIARRNKGTGQLLAWIAQLGFEPRAGACTVDYGPEIEPAIAALAAHLNPREPASPHMRAAMLLAGRVVCKTDEEDAALQARAAALRRDIERHAREPVEDLFIARWYGFAHGVARTCVTQDARERFDLTARLDDVLTRPVLGLVFFGLCMAGTFELVFALGNPLIALLEQVFAWLGASATAVLPTGALRSLLVDGVIGGVGGVVVFLPNILLLFLAIGFLEDSGYMARAAFVMDGIMHRLGLHGKSFIPMLLGFGCNVPAIMATRTLETKRDRLITSLIIPFMSCGARLPVYALFIGAFFAPHWQAPVLMSLYLLGILVAVAMANLLGLLFFGSDRSPLLLELPPYRLPTLRSVLMLVWTRAWSYLKKAGTVLLAASIVMWYLCTHPAPPGGVEHETRFEHSYAGTVGKAIEPLLRPLGFDWKVSVALVTGFMAKEAVVSTLAVVYDVGDGEGGSHALQNTLREDPVFRNRPLVAYTLMVFVLLYVPCLGVIAIFLKEYGWKWTAFMAAYTTVVAWVAAFLVRMAGVALGF